VRQVFEAFRLGDDQGRSQREIARARAPLLIDVRSTSIGSTTSAKEVSIIERTISVTGNDLH